MGLLGDRTAQHTVLYIKTSQIYLKPDVSSLDWIKKLTFDLSCVCFLHWRGRNTCSIHNFIVRPTCFGLWPSSGSSMTPEYWFPFSMHRESRWSCAGNPWWYIEVLCFVFDDWVFKFELLCDNYCIWIQHNPYNHTTVCWRVFKSFFLFFPFFLHKGVRVEGCLLYRL